MALGTAARFGRALVLLLGVATACSAKGDKTDGGGTAGATGGSPGYATPGANGDVAEDTAPPACLADPGPIAPGGCLLVLAAGQTAPSGLALDGANVYWTQMLAGNNALMRVAAGGGDATAVISSAARPVAIGGANAYLFSGNGVMPGRIGDGQPPIPFQGLGGDVGANATHVYLGAPAFGMASVLTIVPIAGGAETKISTATGGRIHGVALDSSAVFWTYEGVSFTDSSYNPPAVMKAGLDGTQPVALAGGGSDLSYVGLEADAGGGTTGNDGGAAPEGGSDAPATPPYAPTVPSGIAVDATHLYWSDSGNETPPAGRLLKMPLAGGAIAVLASGLVGPGTIAVDDASLYATDADGTIVKVSLSGGPPTTLISGRSRPHDVKVDGTSVYWLEDGDATGVHGLVLKLTPQ